jgi:hypothetical protein
LVRLAAQPDVALSRETLMSEVGDENWFGSTKTLDVHVASLRRKIGEIAASAGAHVPAIVRSRCTDTGWGSGRRNRELAAIARGGASQWPDGRRLGERRR